MRRKMTHRVTKKVEEEVSCEESWNRGEVCGNDPGSEIEKILIGAKLRCIKGKFNPCINSTLDTVYDVICPPLYV